MPKPYNQFEWNKRFLHKEPHRLSYWVKNFQTDSGTGQGRAISCNRGKEFQTEIHVYPTGKESYRGPSGMYPTATEAKNAVDEYFETLG